MLQVAKRDAGGNVKEWSVGEGWWEGRKGGGGGKYRKLQRRIFKGVPDRWRRAVWGLEMERVAKEGGGGGRVISLEELEKEYQVRAIFGVSTDALLTHRCPHSASSPCRRRRTFRSTSTSHEHYLVTSCFIHATDKASGPSSTSCTPSGCTATTLAATAKAWDRSRRLYCATLSPRYVTLLTNHAELSS